VLNVIVLVMVARRESEGGDNKKVVVYVCWGGYLKQCLNRMAAYTGGRRDCWWVKEKMSALELQMLV